MNSAKKTDVVSVGLSHHTAPVAVREIFAVPEAGLAAALEELVVPPVRGAVLVSTCNRVEIWAEGEEGEGLRGAIEAFFRRRGLSAEHGEILRFWRLPESAQRLYEIGAGLDSLVSTLTATRRPPPGAAPEVPSIVNTPGVGGSPDGVAGNTHEVRAREPSVRWRAVSTMNGTNAGLSGKRFHWLSRSEVKNSRRPCGRICSSRAAAPPANRASTVRPRSSMGRNRWKETSPSAAVGWVNGRNTGWRV
ncbi:MAG: hypothetical protein HUU04_08230, partial [Verrucomicrobiae bacterium]|nr:hypothetical protein [Verrucomicrobiae bacterium]